MRKVYIKVIREGLDLRQVSAGNFSFKSDQGEEQIDLSTAFYGFDQWCSPRLEREPRASGHQNSQTARD